MSRPRMSSGERRNRNKYINWLKGMRASKCDPKPEKKPPEYGPKMQIQAAYRENKNIKEAYKKAEELNKKIGRNVYSKEMVALWVEEIIEEER